MRLRPAFLLAALLLLAFLSGGLALSLRAPARPGTGARDGFSPEEFSLLREGDILLRRGDSLASALIVRVLGSQAGISHCALLVDADPVLIQSTPESRISFHAGRDSFQSGGMALIHAVSPSLSKVDGVQLEDLARFNQRSAADSVIVLRPRMTDAQRRAFVSRAKALLAQALPFDNGYSLQSQDALYCSELFHLAFAASGWEGQGAWTEKHGILSFDGFFDERFFDLVLSHNPAHSPPNSPLNF